MKKLLFYWCWAVFLLVFVSVASPRAQTPMWGPEVFVRGTGQPVTDTMYFSVPDSTWQYTIVVQNGVPSGIRVGSATIRINGEVIVGPNEFNQDVSEIRKPIQLRKENEITVRLTSKPGGTITVAIYGPSSTTAVTPQGGTVNLNGITSVTFPAGAFSTDNTIIVYVSSDAKTREDFRISTLMYDAGPSAEYEIRINTGVNSSDSSFEMEISVPETLVNLVNSGYELQVFVRIYQTGGLAPLDNFTAFPSTYEPLSHSLRLRLPPWALTNKRNQDVTYEAIVIIGTTPIYEGGE
jgi:hypothetical protein